MKTRITQLTVVPEGVGLYDDHSTITSLAAGFLLPALLHTIQHTPQLAQNRRCCVPFWKVYAGACCIRVGNHAIRFRKDQEAHCPIDKPDKVGAKPFGGKRHIKTALAMKQEGTSKGFPDLFLPVPNRKFHGLFIEMKRQKGGALSKEQKAWLEYLNHAGYQAVVCKGFLEAKEVIKCYLNDTTNTTENG